MIIECAGKKVESEVIVAYKENPSFTEVVKYMDVVSSRKGAPTRLGCTMAVLHPCTVCLLRVRAQEGSFPQGFALPRPHGLAADQNLWEEAH